MDNCIFCKIVKSEIPSYKVYEDDNFLAFLDITPRNKGHTLVVPKKHYRWVWDCQEEYGLVVNKIANAIKKAFSTERVVSIVMGDEVAHAHIHLLPRFDDDGHGALVDLSNIKKFSAKQMQEMADLIKKQLQ